MATVNITNLTNSEVIITGVFGLIPKRGSRVYEDVTVQQLEMARPSLVRLKTNGIISYDVTGSTDPEDDDLEFLPGGGGGGGGSVVGPVSSTDNALTRFNGSSGELLQNSNVIVSDGGDITTPGSISVSNITVSGTVDGRDVAADGTKLDGIAPAATATPLSSTSPAPVGTAAIGVGTTAARSDHVHAHGNQLGGSLHATAVGGVSAGFISAANQGKLDGIEASADVTDASNVAAAGAVMESDYTPAYSILAQQVGTGSPSSVAVGTNTIVGRISGDIDDLTPSQVKTLLATTAAEVTFTPDGDISATNAQAAVVEVRNDTDTKLGTKVQIGGQIGGTISSPTVVAITETSGPTALTLGAIADGEFLVRSGSTVVGAPGGGGSGDVVGPVSATDDAITRFDLTTGKLIQNSLVTINDAGSISLPGGQTVDGRDVSVDGTKLDGIEALADVTDAANVAASGAVMDADFAGATIGVMRRTGAGTYAVLQDNLTAVVAPTVAADSSAGYAPGSAWVDTAADQVYICADASVGAAVWRQIPASPGVTDHGALTGLADDDHTQYLLADGTRVVANYLDFTEAAAPAAPGAAVTRVFATARNGFSILNAQGDDGYDIELGRDSTAIVRNTSGSPMTIGQVVTITGSTGSTPNVNLADASDPALTAFGITTDAIADNAFGRVLIVGALRGVDTSLWVEGTPLYASATVPGELTSTIPTHPNLIERVGIVLNQNVSTGVINVEVHDATGDEHGTRENDFKIGDTTAGTKTLTFRNTFDLQIGATPTANRVLTLPDVTGELVVTAGQIGGTGASPTILGARETSGPTLLTYGAIADGQVFTRSGTSIVGTTPGSGGGASFRGIRGFSLTDYLERATGSDLGGNASPGFEIYVLANADDLVRGSLAFTRYLVSTAAEFVGPGYHLGYSGDRPTHNITDGGGSFFGNFVQEWLLQSNFKKPLIPISIGFDGATRFLKLAGRILFSNAMTGYTASTNAFRVGRPGGSSTGGSAGNTTIFALAAKTDGVLTDAQHETAFRTFLATGDLPNGVFTSRWSFASLPVGAVPATVPDAIGANTLTLVGSLSVVDDGFAGTAIVGDPAATSIKIGGQIGGSVTAPDVRGIRETSGPTLLTLGSIPDGEYVRRVGSTAVGGTPLRVKTVRGFASGAAAGDRAAYERTGGTPFPGSLTMAAIFQCVTTGGGEQRICGTTTEFATNGICLAYDDPGYLVVRGSDNAAASFALDLSDGKLGLDLMFACVTFDSTTGVVTLGVNGAPRTTFAAAVGALNGGSNFTIGAGSGAPGTTAASDQEIHGAAIVIGTAITAQQERDWWRTIAAGAGIGSGPAGEAWEATSAVPTSSTWAPSVGATSLARVGSAAAPTRHDAGRVWYRA